MLIRIPSCAYSLLSVCYMLTLNGDIRVSARGGAKAGSAGGYGGDYDTTRPDIGKIIGLFLIGIIAMLTICYCFRNQFRKRCRKKKASHISISPTPEQINTVQMQSSHVTIVVESTPVVINALEGSNVLEVSSSMEANNVPLYQTDTPCSLDVMNHAARSYQADTPSSLNVINHAARSYQADTYHFLGIMDRPTQPYKTDRPQSFDMMDRPAQPYHRDRKSQLVPLYSNNGDENSTQFNSNNKIVIPRTSELDTLTTPSTQDLSPSPIYDVTVDIPMSYPQWRFY